MVTIPVPPSVGLVPAMGLTRGGGTVVLQILAQPGPNGAEVTGILGYYSGLVADIRFGLAVGDLNGDGKPDIVVANYTYNGVTVLLNETVP